MIIKIPIKELKGKIDVKEKIISILINCNDAYTVSGLTKEIFSIKEDTLAKPYRDMPKGTPTKITQIRLALGKLMKEDNIIKIKHGKAWFYYWKDNKIYNSLSKIK